MMSSSKNSLWSKGFNEFPVVCFSYIISVGIVDKLTQYLRMVQGPIDGDKEGAEFLQCCLGLLVAITKFMSKR